MGPARSAIGTRITLADLPERRAGRIDAALDRALARLGAAEGSACRADCDCRIGLVCTGSVCLPKE